MKTNFKNRVMRIFGTVAIVVYVILLLLNMVLFMGSLHVIATINIKWYQYFLPHHLAYTFVFYLTLLATTIYGQLGRPFNIRLTVQAFVSGVLLLYASLYHGLEDTAIAFGAGHLATAILFSVLNIYIIKKDKNKEGGLIASWGG